MGRNRPGKRERRARLKRLEATARSTVKNFDPCHPSYFTTRDSTPAMAPRATFTGAGFQKDPDCLDIPLEFSPIVSPEGVLELPPLTKADNPRPPTPPPESPPTQGVPFRLSGFASPGVTLTTTRPTRKPHGLIGYTREPH